MIKQKRDQILNSMWFTRQKQIADVHRVHLHVRRIICRAGYPWLPFSVFLSVASLFVYESSHLCLICWYTLDWKIIEVTNNIKNP